MAIYTQYGRYLKAKMMKEALSSNDTDTYMVFGLGNPQWDAPESGQEIPVASYNTYSLRNPDNSSENQFYDENIYQYFISSNDFTSFICPIESGDTGDRDTFIDKYKYLLPIFPAIWRVNDPAIITIGSTPIDQNDYYNYYIVKENNQFNLYKSNSIEESNVSMPTGEIEKQYFAELYLRGMSLVQNQVDSPVGLLGAIKCEVSLVRELGGVENYTGNIHQFYYGDRYWEIADNSSVDVEKDNQNFPTHLFISTLVNPRYLCSDLNIDLNTVPRHIAIYTKKRKIVNGVVESGKNYYRVGDTTHPYAFNFGQYYWDPTAQNNWRSIINDDVELPSGVEMLNFTLPCTVDGKEFPDELDAFKFILNDYIHGTPRQAHVADRFGYVVGF
jgi:hypothetical protein